MRPVWSVLAVLGVVISLAPVSRAATVTGTVKGPDDAPFRGAIVEAENLETKISVHVFSNGQGQYRLDGLILGDYRVQARSVGFRTDTRQGVTLTSDQNATYDFSLQKGTVRWSDLSGYEGRALLPDDPEKARLKGTCFGCHQFQTRMASTVRDQDGWLDRINFMRTTEAFALANPKSPHYVSDDEANRLAAYLAKMFGPDSILAKSPADLPEYQKLKDSEVKITEDGLKLVYVTYPMGGNYLPGAGSPEPDGYVYAWEIAKRQFARVNPKTGEVKQIQVPGDPIAFVHSVRSAPDGMIWYTQRNGNTLGRWDPKTGNVTLFDDKTPGYKHTLIVDRKGTVWATGSPLSALDPETGKFTHFDEIQTAYGLDLDARGNLWFSDSRTGIIGEVDGNTRKVTTFTPPSTHPPIKAQGPPDELDENQSRRLKVSAQGIVWFGEYSQGKIASFDPKTQKFKEYSLPGPTPTPYALGIDRRNHIWYSSIETDTIGELDPATGKVTVYPFLNSEIQVRDFFMDGDGRMWWGAHTSNQVGYFYIAGPNAPKQAFAGYVPKTAAMQ